MHFPKFWARGEAEGFSAWRWSDESFEAAKRAAEDAAKRRAVLWRAGGLRAERSPYGYGTQPLREETLESIPGEGGEPAAVLTRNAGGALILNTARVMFVDIDVSPPQKPRKSAVGFLASFFGRAAPPAAAGPSEKERVLERVRSFVRANGRYSFRVYETKGGFRLLATHSLMVPDSSEVRSTFAALGCDPLYQTLCERQKSFRARVSPKPWRVGEVAAPCRWPIVGFPHVPKAELERRFDQWLKTYETASQGYASCSFLETVGGVEVRPEIRPVLDAHDKWSRATSGLPLA